jgi:hypothetical protein
MYKGICYSYIGINCIIQCLKKKKKKKTSCLFTDEEHTCSKSIWILKKITECTRVVVLFGFIIQCFKILNELSSKAFAYIWPLLTPLHIDNAGTEILYQYRDTCVRTFRNFNLYIPRLIESSKKLNFNKPIQDIFVKISLLINYTCTIIKWHI